METGVACVGTYDEEAFDQRDDIQVSNASAGGLGDSISFGRFSADTFSWVKRSSFNHNQYLEEVETCSTPGSVREKKAYFEAYYKAIAKRKALEKALAEGNVEGQNFEDLGNGVHNNKQDQQFSPPINTSDFLSANIPSVSMDKSTANVGNPQEPLSMVSPRQEDIEENSYASTSQGLQELNSEPRELNFESQESNSEGAAQGLNVESAEEPSQKVFSESCKRDEHGPVPCKKECQENDSLLVSGMDDLGQENAHFFQDEKCESVPQFDSSAHADRVDDRRDAEILDKFEANELPRPETPKSFDLMETPLQSVDEHIDLEVKQAENRSALKDPSKSDGQRQKEKSFSSSVVNSSNVATKAIDGQYGNASKRQGPGGVVELRSHQRPVNTGNSRSNITVPQPFALATDKRASLLGNLPEQDGAKAAEKPVRSSPSYFLLATKRAQASSKPEKKASAQKSLADENKKKQGKCEQKLETENELKQGVVEKSAVALHSQTKNAGKSIRSHFSNNTNAFNFKSDERAEKRKEFNSKLEARLSAKEAEKNQAEAKTQEEAVEEIKQLRKSLNFKATPMPNFYQESTQPKMNIKKAGIQTTRAKSPKLGRRCSDTVGNSGSNSVHSCLGSSSKQVKHAGPVSHNNTNSAEASNDASRKVSVMSKKNAKRTCKALSAAENTSTQPSGKQDMKFLDEGKRSTLECSLPDPHEVEEAKIHGLRDDCPTKEVFDDDKSNTLAVDTNANDTIQCKDGPSVENSADDKKYDDVERIAHYSCTKRSLDGLNDVTDAVSNTALGEREESENATGVQSSNAAEKEIPKKDPDYRNDVSGEKLEGERLSRKDVSKSAVALVDNLQTGTEIS